MLIERFRRDHPTVFYEKSIEPIMQFAFGYCQEMAVLHMQMPPNPDPKRFYTVLLNTLGYQVKPSLRTSTLEVAVLKKLQEKKTRMIVIDELHNILAGRSFQQREFINILRFLGNEMQLPLVGVGTEDAYLAIRYDPQLENRFSPFILPLWQANEEYYALLASFESLLPLRLASHLTEKGKADYILQKTGGVLGEISQLLSKAAEAALIAERREFISDTTLQCCGYFSPVERRQMMERQLR